MPAGSARWPFPQSCVVAGTEPEVINVSTGTTRQGIVSCTTDQFIVTGSGIDNVVSASAIQGVIPQRADHRGQPYPSPRY